MFERYVIEEKAFVVERHDDDAINTKDSVISQRPHEYYKIREVFKLSGTFFFLIFVFPCIIIYGFY